MTVELTLSSDGDKVSLCCEGGAHHMRRRARAATIAYLKALTARDVEGKQCYQGPRDHQWLLGRGWTNFRSLNVHSDTSTLILSYRDQLVRWIEQETGTRSLCGDSNTAHDSNSPLSEALLHWRIAGLATFDCKYWASGDCTWTIAQCWDMLQLFDRVLYPTPHLAIESDWCKALDESTPLIRDIVKTIVVPYIHAPIVTLQVQHLPLFCQSIDSIVTSIAQRGLVPSSALAKVMEVLISSGRFMQMMHTAQGREMDVLDTTQCALTRQVSPFDSAGRTPVPHAEWRKWLLLALQDWAEDVLDEQFESLLMEPFLGRHDDFVANSMDPTASIEHRFDELQQWIEKSLENPSAMIRPSNKGIEVLRAWGLGGISWLLREGEEELTALSPGMCYEILFSLRRLVYAPPLPPPSAPVSDDSDADEREDPVYEDNDGEWMRFGELPTSVATLLRAVRTSNIDDFKYAAEVDHWMWQGKDSSRHLVDTFGDILKEAVRYGQHIIVSLDETMDEVEEEPHDEDDEDEDEDENEYDALAWQEEEEEEEVEEEEEEEDEDESME